MPATHTKTRIAIAVCAIAAFGGVTAAQARVIIDPPANGKQVQPIRAKVAKRITSTRFDGGYPCRAGVHVRVPAEAKTE
jgi:hypothetical protein